MDRPPYWTAARIFSAAAGPIAHARISGAYALANGGRFDDLDPDLYLDVVESWLWDHFSSQENADEWVAETRRPPMVEWDDLPVMTLRAAITEGHRVAGLMAGDAVFVDDSPPGWDNASLLAQSKAVGIFIE